MMMHKDLTEAHWFGLSLMEQLANVGCDVERSLRLKKRGDMEASRMAFYRALELLDLTKADPKNRKGALRELCRMREALVDYCLYDNEYNTTEQSWLDYFYQFNYAAALERGR